MRARIYGKTIASVAHHDALLVDMVDDGIEEVLNTTFDDVSNVKCDQISNTTCYSLY